MHEPTIDMRDVETRGATESASSCSWGSEAARARAVILLVLGLLGAALLLRTPPARAQEAPTDDRITRTIRTRLAAFPELAAGQVTVRTTDGIVTLSGSVDNLLVEERIVAMVSQVYGVRSIIEDLTIEETGLPDATIQALVREAITHEPPVSTWDVGATVDGGTVGTLYEKKLAVAAAREAGARAVNAENQTVEPRAYEMSGRMETLVGIADTQIRRAVEEALLLDPRTQPFSIDVTVEDGAVTLSGTVKTLEASRSAERDARHTTGVSRVENEIRVSPIDAITDEVISNQIDRALLRDPVVEGSAVDVQVKDGRAFLRGTVDSYYAHSRAERIAARVGGVSTLVNELTVRGSG